MEVVTLDGQYAVSGESPLLVIRGVDLGGLEGMTMEKTTRESRQDEWVTTN